MLRDYQVEYITNIRGVWYTVGAEVEPTVANPISEQHTANLSHLGDFSNPLRQVGGVLFGGAIVLCEKGGGKGNYTVLAGKSEFE